MEVKRLYEETLKEKNYWVAVLALSTALVILMVMLTVKVTTGNEALVLISGVVAFAATLMITAALKVQHQATVLKLVASRLGDEAREKPAASAYNAQGKVLDPPASGQHIDPQA